jgi:hypothetical protein
MKKSSKTQRTAPVGVIQGMTKHEVKAKDEVKKDEEDAENLRSQKLLNSRSNSKGLIVCEFFFVTGVFIGYYILSFVLESIYLKDISQLYDVTIILFTS